MPMTEALLWWYSMQYEELMTIIQSKRRFGQAYGRDVTREMMSLLGYPEIGMQIIHIAGTNGKGSTAAFVSSILQAAGFVVGQFTSPHLIRFTERIRICGKEISKEDVVRLGQKILELPMTLEYTMFDICLGIAILYFREQGCDYVVLETGLGGAKDSTAGLKQVPLVCGITNIGLDHTAVLGETLEEIADQKAGILKPGTRLVLGKMDEKARNVIEKRARELMVPFQNVDNLLTKISTYKIRLNGLFQRENAALAVGIVEAVFHKKSGYLSEEVIRRGLEETRWPGRMEVLSEHPFVMVDGAHNPQGVEALFNSLKAMYPGEKFVFLVGVMADKDYAAMMARMLPAAECFLTAAADSTRSLQSDELAELLVQMGAKARSFDGLPPALEKAMEWGRIKNRRVIAFGSLYFIGEVKSYMEKNGKEHHRR